jgi:hypothetical protein
MENYSEAAAIYIRMTSEDCDLKSALMLEQAAHAFLNVNYIRKYALHCVLAGNFWLCTYSFTFLINKMTLFLKIQDTDTRKLV